MSALQVLAFVLLSTIACGAIAFVLLQPRLEAERKSEARLNQFKKAETDGSSKRVARDRLQEAAKRRKTIQSSLKEIEDKQKERSKFTSKPSLTRRMEQAGLKIGDRQFVIGSVGLGILVAFVLIIVQQPFWLALSGGFVSGYGLPRLFVESMRKRRQAKFIDELPNAIDLIVRGVKSGLPVNDTMRMIASEAAEPVRSEFQKVVEAQQVGLTMAEAVERLYQNVPLPEVNFFAIVVSIQAQAGGNLSEALGNLSRVLRDRKRMKAKIQAMSMEAKASGGIIGALPFVVAALVYLTTPDYISLLWTEPVGNLLLVGSAVWMTIGVVVMRQMIHFDF